jgi:hypothetical protein
VVKGFVLMVAAGVAAVVGVIVGVVPVQVLDQGQWVACGPAMLDGGGRFADLACSGVVQPLQTLAVVLLVAALILIGYGVSALRSSGGATLPGTRSMERASAG